MIVFEECSGVVWFLGWLWVGVVEDCFVVFVESEGCVQELGFCQDEVWQVLCCIWCEDGVFSWLGDLIDGYD